MREQMSMIVLQLVITVPQRRVHRVARPPCNCASGPRHVGLPAKTIRRTAMSRPLGVAAVALTVGLAAVMVGVQPAGAAGPRHHRIDGLFDVGGYRLYLRCTGTGTPTVVMH